MSFGRAQFQRLGKRGGTHFKIIIDGRSVEVQEGDFVITAILTNQHAVRRFEFGDGMRAGFCLMAACQDCWVQLGDGRRVRACDTVVQPSMEIITGIFNDLGSQVIDR